jgi:hypothetical protein
MIKDEDLPRLPDPDVYDGYTTSHSHDQARQIQHEAFEAGKVYAWARMGEIYESIYSRGITHSEQDLVYLTGWNSAIDVIRRKQGKL